MKILVAVDDGKISNEIGNCKTFAVYETEDKSIIKKYDVSAPGQGITSMFGFFTQQSADILICGDISRRAKNTIILLGLMLVPGVDGSADDAVNKLLAGEKIGKPELLEDPETEYSDDDPMSCMHDCEKCTAECSSKFKIQ